MLDKGSSQLLPSFRWSVENKYLHVLGKVVGCAVVTQLHTELKLVFRITGDRHGLRFEPLKHKGKTVNINTQDAR